MRIDGLDAFNKRLVYCCDDGGRRQVTDKALVVVDVTEVGLISRSVQLIAFVLSGSCQQYCAYSRALLLF